MIFDTTICTLGEGPMWHPKRQSLFWFDILNARMFERAPLDTKPDIWQFDEYVSAAGWVDENTLLIASETALFRYDLSTKKRHDLSPLEADNAITRSNDGRADPWGGFWISTMGKQAEKNAGAIYRYHRGELVQLFDNITIPNSICFAPDGKIAYFTDTPTQIINRVTLDENGWPIGAPTPFANVAPNNPDGAVVDTDGNLWNAQWGASRVACYDSSGQFLSAQTYDATQISCPAFGGADLQTLFATSASIDLLGEKSAGKTFAKSCKSTGQSEHQIILG